MKMNLPYGQRKLELAVFLSTLLASYQEASDSPTLPMEVVDIIISNVRHQPGQAVQRT